MPAGPGIGEGMRPRHSRPRARAATTTASIASSRTAESRTTPPFADLPPSGLELGLDQGHQIGALGEERHQRRQHEPQRDERDVHGDEVETTRKVLAREVAGVDTLLHDHARVLAQPPVELSPAHVQRDDLRRTALQEHVR